MTAHFENSNTDDADLLGAALKKVVITSVTFPHYMRETTSMKVTSGTSVMEFEQPHYPSCVSTIDL